MESRRRRNRNIFPDYLEKELLQAMLKAHPYEEVAYDIYLLIIKEKHLGLVELVKETEMTLEEFANKVKKALDVPTVRVVGDLNSKVKKVAVLGGDGNKYISSANSKGQMCT